MIAWYWALVLMAAAYCGGVFTMVICLMWLTWVTGDMYDAGVDDGRSE